MVSIDKNGDFQPPKMNIFSQIHGGMCYRKGLPSASNYRYNQLKPKLVI